MKIIRSYILKDFVSTFIFSILILTTVMLLGNLIKITDMVIRKGVHIFDAVRMLAVFMPFTLRFTVPWGFLLGVLLAMGRLIADNEIIAINIAGLSLFKILNVFLILGIMFSLFLFILNDKVIPGFQYRYRSIAKGVYSKNVTALIEPGVFLEYFQNFILYVSDKDEYKLKNIFVYETNSEYGTSKVTFAKQGRFVVEGNKLKMELEEGFRDETRPDNKKELYRMNFSKFFMEIPIEEKKDKTIKQKPCDMNIQELREKIQYFKKMGINPVELEIEFHQRVNYSFSVITFILLGFGVSLAVRHREKTINFGIAFLAGGLYYLLFILGQTLVQHRILMPALGMWLANLVISAIALFFIYKNAYRR